MGNECCRVKNYIDEDEEWRNPMENSLPSLIEKNVNIKKHFNIIPEEEEIEPKNYSDGECIIADEEQPKSLEYISYSEELTKSNNNSVDIVSQSSIISFD